MAETNTIHFSWEAPEFKQYDKSFGWYSALYFILLILTAYQIIVSDYFGAATMVILAVLITLFAKRKPEVVTVELDNEGVTLGKLYIPYKHFKHFWIVNTKDHKTLNLEASTYLRQTIIIELLDQDGAAIRNLLLKHLAEAENSLPSFSQRIAHRFHF